MNYFGKKIGFCFDLVGVISLPRALSKRVPVDGTEMMLKALDQQNIPWVVVSNSSYLTETEFTKYCDFH